MKRLEVSTGEEGTPSVAPTMGLLDGQSHKLSILRKIKTRKACVPCSCVTLSCQLADYTQCTICFCRIRTVLLETETQQMLAACSAKAFLRVRQTHPTCRTTPVMHCSSSDCLLSSGLEGMINVCIDPVYGGTNFCLQMDNVQK